MSALADPSAADYDTDFYAWTQEQAQRLRALRVAGRLPSELDVDNIAEEIEDMGRSDLRSARRLMLNAIVHLLKICSVPGLSLERHWKSEANNFLLQLWDDAYAPSMRQRIDIEKVWKSACQQAGIELEEYGNELIGRLPHACPLSIDDMTAGPPDIDMLVARILQSTSRDGS